MLRFTLTQNYRQAAADLARDMAAFASAPERWAVIPVLNENLWDESDNNNLELPGGSLAGGLISGASPGRGFRLDDRAENTQSQCSATAGLVRKEWRCGTVCRCGWRNDIPDCRGS
jgi:hypothetical protein